MNVIGYSSIFALNLLFVVIFFVILVVDVQRIKRIADRKLKKIEILNDLMALDLKIKSRNMHRNAYLTQIDHFLNEDPFGIDKRKIVVCKVKNGNMEDQKIYRMYKNASACVKEDMQALSEILGRIYELNHPIKFRMLELKKNIKSRFLLFFLKICCFWINYLENPDEEKNKKKMKDLKKKQQNAEEGYQSMFSDDRDPLILAQAS